jgi:hypothetical protein
MGLERLPSTIVSFEWGVMPSGTERYWRLAWALLAEQTARLAIDGIVPQDYRSGEGSRWAPAVDLALGEVSTFGWTGGEEFVPGRSVWGIASSGCAARLVRGTVLRLAAVIPDSHLGGLGTNFWSVEGTELGVRFIHSALEGRWGGAAVLADQLIVPIDHPIVGDGDRAEDLVRDLQDITRAFRVANDLPAEGRSPSPTGAPPRA